MLALACVFATLACGRRFLLAMPLMLGAIYFSGRLVAERAKP